MADDRSRVPVYAAPYVAPTQVPPASPYGMPDISQQYVVPAAPSPYPPTVYPPPDGQIQMFGYAAEGTSSGFSNDKPPRMMAGVGEVQSVQESGGYQDVWAAVVFILHFIAVAIIAVVLGSRGLKEGFQTAEAPASKTNDVDAEAREIVPQLVVVAVVSFAFAWLWLMLTRAFPKAMVTFALWGGVVAFGIAAIVFAIIPAMAPAIIFGIIAIIQAVYAFFVRHRIPFAAALLGKVTSVVKKFPAMFVVSYCSVLFLVVWYAVWCFGFLGAWSQTRIGVVIFLLLVSLYWTLEVVRNVVHVTVSGAVATYYFQQHNMPQNPTKNALGRAMTKSFGSICLGSFIVAIIQALRTMVRMAAGREGDDLNPFLMSCLLCVLNLIEWLVQYFNKYAFVQVAVYGKSFVRAAKDTWDLFKASGIEALINDDLTDNVLSMGILLDGILCAIFAGCWTAAVNKDLVVGVALLSFVIGVFVAALLLQVVESGVVTYYVCFAEDPTTLSRNDPEFFQVLQQRRDQAQ